MERNMMKAAREFSEWATKHNYNGFSFGEITQILESEPSKAGAIMNGIAAGFMYGYRAGKREARSVMACHNAKLANEPREEGRA